MSSVSNTPRQNRPISPRSDNELTEIDRETKKEINNKKITFEMKYYCFNSIFEDKWNEQINEHKKND